MNRSEFLNFCVANSIIIILIYTMFVIFLVTYATKKMLKMKRTFDKFMFQAEHEFKNFENESNSLDKQTWHIKKSNEKIIIDIQYILKLLDKYKGIKFDTKINHKISKEIASAINSNNQDVYNNTDDTKSIIEENSSEKQRFINLSQVIYEEEEMSYLKNEMNKTNQKNLKTGVDYSCFEEMYLNLDQDTEIERMKISNPVYTSSDNYNDNIYHDKIGNDHDKSFKSKITNFIEKTVDFSTNNLNKRKKYKNYNPFMEKSIDGKKADGI